MICTFENTTSNGFSNTRNLVFRSGIKAANISIAHRGGCLFLSEIFLYSHDGDATKTISSTNGFLNASVGATSEYLSELWEKHIGN